MIKGIGIDIIEIKRIQEILAKDLNQRFINRVFNPSEKQYCEPKAKKAQHYAVRFAGKEALLKALGSGLRQGISWHDIEFSNDQAGKPIAECSGQAKLKLVQLNVIKIHVSFSHSEEYATAVVILE
jgi:holo-[acyl-carrier protein] synthase